MPEKSSFLWGTATASYQIEGAVTEDGRGPSIWDTFSHTPGKVERSETGDVACDHYHRFLEDVRWMRELGQQAYRFSVAWPRVFPSGRGKPNDTGLDFYERLVDSLLEAGIIPFATLFHWDLPQALQDTGGFTNRDICSWFADYATATAQRLGDRVNHWIMLNEPSVFACLGHALGVHAPGLTDLSAFLAVTHHLNLAQGTALQSLASLNGSWQLGTTLNIHRGFPIEAAQQSSEAAERHNDFWNRAFLDPLLLGKYPNSIANQLEPFIEPGDLERIKQPIHFLGLNHYFRAYIRANPRSVLGFDQVAPPPDRPRTSFDWEINAQELREVLLYLGRDYPCAPIYVTENGAYFDDEVTPDGRVHDQARINFLNDYIHAVFEARQQGVDVRGYFVWSLLDNFEWAVGYRATFGLIHVDYRTLERLPKDSFHWYKDQIALYESKAEK
jgi:beta-glucosidase